VKRFGLPLITAIALTALAPSNAVADATAQRIEKLERRIKVLDRRLNVLARRHRRSNELETRTYSTEMISFGAGGFVRGTAICPERMALTGGGALWPSAFTSRNVIHSSGPYEILAYQGWQAEADATGVAQLPRVYVMCAKLG
jgi:hypothetical protein